MYNWSQLTYLWNYFVRITLATLPHSLHSCAYQIRDLNIKIMFYKITCDYAND